MLGSKVHLREMSAGKHNGHGNSKIGYMQNSMIQEDSEGLSFNFTF